MRIRAMKTWPAFLKGDKILWMSILFLSIFSVLAVYSSTGTIAFKYKGGNTEYFLLKHVLILLTGLFITYVAHLTPYSFFSKISNLLYYVSIILLIITFFKGTSYNEASRWLTIPGLNISFQASDIAKFALIIYLAKTIAMYEQQISDYSFFLKKMILPVLIIAFMILPTNFSTAALVIGASMLLIFTSTIPLKYFLYTLGIMIFALAFGIFILYQMPERGRVKTWQNRIEAFVHHKNDVEKNYQGLQAKIAIASGGIFGKMPGNSTQKSFLPNPFSDFIFAFIAEEYGLWGPMLILFFYVVLLYRIIVIARQSPGRFGTYVSLGLGLLIFLQAMVNIGVSTGLLPITGQPLPLVSMGGTSIWITCLSLGIILNISHQKAEHDEHNKLNNQEN